MVFLMFICIGTPLLLMLFLLDKKGRLLIGSLLAGCVICIIASAVNRYLLEWFGCSIKEFVGHISPISEEILKALPIIIFGAFFSKKHNNNLLVLGLSVGFGFAILENVYYIDTTYDIDLFWAVARGFSTALMHGSTTAIVAYGFSLVRGKKLLTVTSTFALLCLAITYHSIYNIILISDYYKYMLFLPGILYLVFLNYIYRKSIKQFILVLSNRLKAKKIKENRK